MRTTLHTLYCIDSTCTGSNGVSVEWIEDTEWEPGEWSRDTCHCGHALETKMVAAAYAETLMGIWDSRRNQ